MASSFGSFELFGSSSNPSRCITLSRRSVKRTVRGSIAGNRSASAIAMSSASIHFIRSPLGGRRSFFPTRLPELNVAAFLDVISRVHREFHDHVPFNHGLAPQPRTRAEIPRRVESIQLVVFGLAEVSLPLHDIEVARRAGTAS